MQIYTKVRYYLYLLSRHLFLDDGIAVNIMNLANHMKYTYQNMKHIKQNEREKEELFI